MTVKTILLLAALVCVIMAGLLMLETKALSIEETEVRIDGLPAAFDGFRIVLISDFHGRRISPGGKEAMAVAEARPDIITLAGDFVHSSAEEISNVLPFIGVLAEVAPVFAVSGNHDIAADWQQIKSELAGAGVTVLDNRHVRLNRGEESLILAGVADPYSGKGRLADALPAEIDAVVVLLAHSPNLV